MNKTSKVLLTLLAIVTVGFSNDSLVELFGTKKTSNTTTTDDNIIKDKFVQRQELVYFTGMGDNTNLNIDSKLLQTDKAHLGPLMLHAELYSTETDTLVGYYWNLYVIEDGSKIVSFTEAGTQGKVELSIPYIWDFPVYVATWVTDFNF